MKKTKVENISGIKLDFFIKQNKDDVRIALMPGESSWCDHETTTKSMILYERKGLIKSSDVDMFPIEIVPLSEEDVKQFIKDIQAKLVKSPAEKDPVEVAKQETEEYKAASEKKYKGKKRGRKKKRGPKPGSKRKNKGSTETPIQ